MMGDMAEVFREMDKLDKERRYRNLANADPTGWAIHTEWHWSRLLCGERVDYWPTKNKWRWLGKMYHGDIKGFIRNRELSND